MFPRSRWEEIWLPGATAAHKAPRHTGRNYQRKTNGGIDSLAVYLQPSPEKK